MAEAFTAGVKMGGLTNDTEIRILLCYLIKSVGPVTREAMEAALLQEELVNYFEFVGALNDLVSQGLAIEGATGYTITEYLTEKRLQNANELLRRGTPVTEACYQSGFRNYAAFLRAYKKKYRDTPHNLSRLNYQENFTI